MGIRSLFIFMKRLKLKLGEILDLVFFKFYHSLEVAHEIGSLYQSLSEFYSILNSPFNKTAACCRKNYDHYEMDFPVGC